jgi:hypothetical protein
MHTKYDTNKNASEMDIGTRPCEYQDIEEELTASKYELSAVEALLLHLNDRKQLLLERISRLNDAFLLKRNHQQVYRCGLSTIKPITSIHDAERNRAYGSKWTEVDSGNPNQLPIDGKPTKLNNSSNSREHSSRKLSQ